MKLERTLRNPKNINRMKKFKISTTTAIAVIHCCGAFFNYERKIDTI